jgi:YfiH family protein
MIEAIQSPLLKKITTVKHGFFTRQGGVSSGYYYSLNCSYGCDDSIDNIIENRRRAMIHMGSNFESLVSVKNTHGNDVVIVEKLWTNYKRPEADGMVTKHKGIVLGSDSADCPTILFADEQAQVIGIAHAGWRGAKLGIIEATVKKMMQIGADVSNITAVTGPCIAQDSYEVGGEFYEQFMAEDLNSEVWFKPSQKPNHKMFDLRGYVRKRLKGLGLKFVGDIEIDTYKDEKRFFSYRRATHKGEEDFGGHLACICLK